MVFRIFLIVVLIIIMVCPWMKGQTFDNYYKPGYHNWHSTSVITREDSGFVCANFLDDSATGRVDLNLLWIDSKGNQVKSKTINFFNYSVGFFTSGKNYFNKFTKSSLLMQTCVFKGSKQCALFIKYDINSLDSLKTHLFMDISNDCAITNFIRFNENKFYLIGAKWNNSTGKTIPIILHVDSNLNIVSQITVNTPSNFAPTVAVYNRRIKKILLKGKYVMPGIPNTFVHIDTLGVVSQSISSTSSTLDVFNEVEYSDFDSSYIAYAGKVASKYGNIHLGKLSMTKYDHNLNMVWQKTYGEENKNNGLTAMVILPNGDIVASGAYSQLTSLPLLNEDANGVILKTDKDGHLQWFREYDHKSPGPEVEVFWGLDRTKTGGYITCGNIFAQPKPTGVAWFVKTDSIGCVTPGCTSSSVQVDSFPIQPPLPVGIASAPELRAIQVYPNPARENIKVAYDIEGSDNLVIKIVNMMGETILQTEVNSPQTDIDINSLSRGVYFVQAFQDGKLAGVRRFVKE